MLSSTEATCRRVDFTDSAEIPVGDLMRFLGSYPDYPVMFMYEGRDISEGCVVTGMRVGQFSVLDSYGRLECWTEIFVQLHAGNGDSQLSAQRLAAAIRMLFQPGRDDCQLSAERLAATIRLLSDKVSYPSSARLTVEISDGISPIQLQKVAEPEIVNRKIRILLTPRVLSRTPLIPPAAIVTSATCCDNCC